MTSWIGKSIAHYRVASLLGAGGMGEVYRASDSRLGRDVAIKVLPAAFAADPERMARFEREARLLASLSHSNIAGIFGLEESGGARALVMELVEGSTLAERIAQGALPVDDALAIARQIAEALEYAHERGIIHRDLKPANVKVAGDGSVKVLDFGLAKALSDEVPGSAPDLTKSPTLTAASTRLGVILGTAAYMSPEQAKGKPVDRRADIWSFGAVLFEMVCGRQAFAGETVSETLASVMKDEPDWSALPAATPARVRELLRRCLIKEPRQRLRDIGDARIRIEEELSGVAETGTASPAGVAAARSRMPARTVVWVAALAAVAGVIAGRASRQPEPAPVFSASIELPDDMRIDTHDASVAISPDGQNVALAAIAGERRRMIWIRRLDTGATTVIEGTEGASYPFWSPDGRTIGFFAGQKLRRVPVTGGVVQTICDAVDGRGASWSSENTIVFAPGPLSGLEAVPAAGGTPRVLTTPGAAGETHRLPDFLPDGRRVLFVVGLVGADGAQIDCIDIASGARETVLNANSNARYLDGGYLAYVAETNLVIQRFDAESLERTGVPIPIAQGVQLNVYRYTGSFDVSDAGPVVFATGTNARNVQLTWYDLEGGVLGTLGAPAPIQIASISPDGTRVVTGERDERFDLYMWDVATGSRSRFTFGPNAAAFPAWGHDGKDVYYCDGSGGFFAKAADGASAERTAFELPGVSSFLLSQSPDGREFLITVQRAGTASDLWVRDAAGNAEPRILFESPANEFMAEFSPDGRYLALATDESGRDEIVVVPYPSLSGRWQISSEGGNAPAWLPDGRGILYTALDRRLVRVDVDTRDGRFVAGAGRFIFGGRPVPGGWTLSPDGTRILARVEGGGDGRMLLQLTTDWRRLVDANDAP